MSAAVEQSRKKASPSPSSGLWSLPDEIAIDCFARVSRVDHAALSMTSKSNRSLVVSPELYETRSRMGCTEECVYVFIDSPFEPNPRWFILRRGRGSVNNNRNRLIPIPSFPTPRSATLVSLGCGIYVIGGFKKCLKTALVSYLDCRTHTWSYLPSMSVARAEARAGVLDGKIYVFGGCVEDPSIWAEVFDPKLQTWSRVVIPEDLMKATEVSKVVQGEETITVSCNFPRDKSWSQKRPRWLHARQQTRHLFSWQHSRLLGRPRWGC
ncbi:PREDICTED: F-box/kelch-repeat protein At5g49000-like [Camelina sativa]|uniref:F-box/kelch-repeat protein At5g49000-like n=1 Tax=Camelina sativa TaxID=90675 RepID=A0ABM0XZ74_CAMSA|nr:PREDICTED: F-box/kelch-repeat protein At5g49000-like [Camelina sativa]XP_019097336.1 PREDICTED: F-box/kelch-repeat protein At5g49000-like [Camelina sativa]XP_019097337.1 PREDICTED: F-box/kelch-repeat protein At5g49000-like [Camelina sativa]XP_019097338.1 PREDICTED: F-box/kelch-repeat protein At5g49000-like [Camelina sativa]XP_019097339.1 PREDICTED: F-box/kelch-repeat protein At5g49000-like [Camelina sativa]